MIYIYCNTGMRGLSVIELASKQALDGSRPAMVVIPSPLP